jgi:aspartate/methionine/tyrosine aminotransferase
VIICAGLSKAYAIPGLRIGWLVGPKEMVEKAWASHDYTTISPGILGDRVATLVLQPEMRKKVLSRNRKILSDNLALLEAFVKKHKTLFKLIPPRAGAVAFPSYTMKINSTELMMRLVKEKSVFIVAGDCFLMDRYVRIGYGGEKSHFRAALSLIDEALSHGI